MSIATSAQPRVESEKTEIRRALIIDDDEDYRKLLGIKLGRAFPHLIINEIDPLQTPLPDAEFNWDNIDFIILDYNLGIDITGLDWFRKFKSEELPATILLTARGSEELAVTAMKIGIDDYIVKEHFENEQLTNSIIECVGRKRRDKERRFTLSRQSVVFNKPNFIHRLQMISKGRDANHHLLMINPVAYPQIGQERGLHYQDSYIRHVADCVFEQLSPHRISFNIFIYREEYIALLIEASSYTKYLDEIRARLKREKFTIGLKEYSCSVNVGVISPQSLEASELDYLKIPGVDPGVPELSIGTAVAIAWPSAATGFVLESTTDIEPPQTWAQVSASPTVVGDQYYVLLPTPEARTFYRLVRPQAE